MCQPTRVVLLTPLGRGAIASLAVAGPRAAQRVGELFHRRRPVRCDDEPWDRILHGRWGSRDSGEEVVVCCRGAEQVEVHCHGGEAAARAIIASLVERGCEVADWRAWVRETTDDPIAAAARIALADAPTQRVAAILRDQYAGALRRAVTRLATTIAAGDRGGASGQVEELLIHANLGLHLTRPWRVVLAGPPNVGKSSLINSLVGYARAIVHPMPGTTRDIVTADTALDGWPIELADTAGLHASADPIESAGIRLARDHLARADLVLLVFDVATDWASEHKHLMAAWPDSLVIHNKWDLITDAKRPADRPLGIHTSAVTGMGVDRLAAEIVRRLAPRPPIAGSAVPFLAGHVRVITQVRESLASGQLDSALRLLAELEVASDTPC